MKPIALLTVIVSVLILSGCETMQGFGKDLQNLGDQIEKKAGSSE